MSSREKQNFWKMRGLLAASFVALGGMGAPRAEAQEIARTHPIAELGRDAFAEDWDDLCIPKTIEEAVDLAIRGGMEAEARASSIEALQGECAKQTHEIVNLSSIAGTMPVVFDWMLYGGTSGVRRVLGEGAETVTVDTRQHEMRFQREMPGVVIPFRYTSQSGELKEGRFWVPIACLNLSGLPSRVLSAPEPREVVSTSVAVRREGPPVLWSIQENVVAGDCCRTLFVNGMLIAEYEGTVEAAQAYFRQSLRRPGPGVETLLPEDYQEGMSQPFAYLVVRNPQTGEETFWCMEIRNGRFSHPTIISQDRRSGPMNRTEVIERRQFDMLTTGAIELNDGFSMVGNQRGRDISVANIKFPTRLSLNDRNGNGTPDGFVHFGRDLDNDGAIEANEFGRTRSEVIAEQMFLIADTVIQRETGSTRGNENAAQLWAQVESTPIPQAFLQASTESARMLILRAAYPMLNEEQLERLGGLIHYYADLDRSREEGDQFMASIVNNAGQPRTIGQFFNAGVREEIERGVYPDLRQAQ